MTHYPPGASKWNPIDHRMFSLISANWAGEPLVSYETMLNYIRTHAVVERVPLPGPSRSDQIQDGLPSDARREKVRATAAPPRKPQVELCHPTA